MPMSPQPIAAQRDQRRRYDDLQRVERQRHTRSRGRTTTPTADGVAERDRRQRRHIADARRSCCIPSATANSHPMPGLIP